MTAYVVFQLTVVDPPKASNYSAQALSLVMAHGGRSVVTGIATTLHDGTDHDWGAICEFPDRTAALNLFESAEYQALAALRDEAMDYSVVLIG